MNIEYLREFTVLASKLNFRAAAAKLCISQSTLSKHILALEQAYGIQLLRRNRHEVELTEAGTVLLDYAFRIIRLYEESLEVSSLYGSADSRVIRVSGLFDNPQEKALVEKIFATANNDIDNIALRLASTSSMSSYHLSSLLEEDKLDAFITYDPLSSPANRWSNRYIVNELARIPLTAVVSKEDSLASKSTLDINDLVGRQFIHLVGPLFTPTWSLIEQILESTGIPYHVKPIPTSSVYDYSSVDVSRSILLVPFRKALDHQFNNPDHCYISIDDDRFALNLVEIHLANKDNPAIERFIEIYRTEYSDAEKQ